MFSPVGKKKILLQQKFSGSTERMSRVGSAGSLGSRSPSRRGGSISSRSSSPAASLKDDSVKKMRLLAPTSMVAANGALEKALGDVGMTGNIMRKLLEATTRYRPHRDAILLKAFESKTISYDFFRLNLNSAFWVSFSDEEFRAVTDYFDPTRAGIIDGYSFMIAFTRLAAMRKDHEAAIVREKQEIFEKNKQAQEERDKLEKEKKNDLAIDYGFNEATKQSALSKLENAAKKFDPYHPAAPSTIAFEVKKIKPAEFKEMLKLTFNLKLDRAELGAIVSEFVEEEVQEIPGIDFMKYFFRIGFEAREEEKKQQRAKQAMLDKKAAEEREKKMLEAKNKNQLKVDYNYTPEDEENATEKLRVASEKYDKNATGAVALDGFDSEELSPADFRELLKKVFNVQLTNTELGFLVQKYDIKRTGNLHCKTFLTEMLQLGRKSRHKNHVEQLQKQRKLLQQAEKEHIQKMLSVQKDEHVPLSTAYSDEHLQSALYKLTEASVKFDKARGGSLESFEAAHLDLVQFKRGLKRAFNLVYTAKEMGAMLEFLGVGEDKLIDCHRFLTTFTTLGAAERARIRTEQIRKQREGEKQMKAEHEKKIEENLNKTLHADIDFEYSEVDRDSALRKMIESAYRYDAAHPAAMSLQSFEKKFMMGSEFRDTVKKTFFLHLTPKEVGALFKYFADRVEQHGLKALPFDQIDCGEFLTFFLQVGITERGNFHRQQLEKQRRESEEREAEHRRKVEELANRKTYQPDFEYTIDDQNSIQQKLEIASEKFDKNHPAAPSLEAFDAALMAPGIFRENIKSIFGVRATPKEIGYLLSVYDKDRCGSFHTKDFLIKFFAMGKAIRDEKRKESLAKQREAFKQAKEEAEQKVLQLTEKTDYQIDPNFTLEDFYEAEQRMTSASEKYDKTHPSAPNLDGFNGPVSPGAFRELMKRAFNIYLNPREVGAILQRFHVENNTNIIDGKKFIIYFIRLGYDVRNNRKSKVLKEQRQTQEQIKKEQERKLVQAMQKNELELVNTYTEQQKDEAMKKLTDAAALYDKNAPGSVSLDVFHAKFLTPGVFREVVKRTFNLNFSAEELAAVVNEFNNGKGNVDTSKFLVTFIKMGSEERERRKAIQIEKQRRMDLIREAQEKLKLKQAEEKMALKVSYVYNDEEKVMAFQKLAAAAKKYDKAHPAAMSLQGFEEKAMKPHVFREMLKRTFNFLPTPGELGALMHHFDQKGAGEVSSHKFLVHFLKLGIAERDKEHKESLKKLREDEEFRERFHREQMAAQWAKAELNVTFDFSEEDKRAAMEKLADAAQKFDPASPGPTGLTAFQASVLSPAVFREMLKRCFNLRLTNGELAALIEAFDRDGARQINCADFMVTFSSLGYERRSAIRAAQLEKQRRNDEIAKKEWLEKQRQADMKMELALESFSDQDFNCALNKIRLLASNYDRSHPSAPSLKGFIGTDMKPSEFKQMMLRTFNCNLTNKELSALVAYFPSKMNEMEKTVDLISTTKSIDSDMESAPSLTNRKGRSKSPTRDAVLRLDNKAFLAYFNKIQREEQNKRHKQRIARDRDFIEAQKVKEEEEEEKKRIEIQEQLTYTEEDEQSVVSKIKHAVKEYATDGAVYQEALQGYKGPALPPDKFRDLFYRIFSIKFTFPELGVLLAMLDPAGLGVFDGPRFLTWFYKLSRIEEKFLLGESEEQIDFEVLQRIAVVPSGAVPPSTANTNVTSPKTPRLGARSLSTASSNSLTRLQSRKSGRSSREGATSFPDAKRLPSRNRSNERHEQNLKSRDPFEEAFGFSLDSMDDDNSTAQLHSFSLSTLDRQWILPSLAASQTNTGESVEEIESIRQHLQGLFMTNDPDPDYNHQIKSEQKSSKLSKYIVSKSLNSLDLLTVESSIVSQQRGSEYPQKRNSLDAYTRVQTAPNTSKSKKKRAKKLESINTNNGDKSPGQTHSRVSTAQDEEDERDFLSSLFSASNTAANSHSQDSKKTTNKLSIADPVSHLLNIKKHFKQAPRFVVREKSKAKKVLAPVSKGKTCLAETDVQKTEGKEEKKESNDLEADKGGFFFPALLTAPLPMLPNLANSADEEENATLVVDMNNVEIVGSVSEMSQKDLREILTSQ